ncbi:MAG TPA: GtrA family protein [Acholeplasmataceae bacterium]|nr:GtrA family protein [Acholeplasmataceae bacterium]
MKNQTTKEAIKFTLFSISAGIIQITSFTILELTTSFSYWPSYLISVVLSVLWNFTFNRKYTFYGTNNVYKAMMLTLLFYVFFIPITTIGGNNLEKDYSWNGFIIIGLTMLLNFVLEFIYTKYVVYYKDEKTNEEA